MNTECHCGQIKVDLQAAPEKLNRCSCSICRRYGALWAYFDPAALKILGRTDTYIWGDKMIAFHRCPNCGVLTHWSHIDGHVGKIGINMQNADQGALTKIPQYDGHLMHE
jgi:hypothetical protein